MAEKSESTKASPSHHFERPAVLRSVWNVLTTVPWISIWTILVCVVGGFTLAALPSYLGDRLVKEGGVVENASAVLYAVAFLVAVMQIKLHWKRKDRTGTTAASLQFAWISGAAVLLWLLFREFDAQKVFTYRSVESIGFYTRPIAPLWQKVLAPLVLLPAALALLYLLRLAARNFFSAIAQREGWLGHFVGIGFLGFLSLICEKALEFTALEEMCELGLAFLTLRFTFAARSGKIFSAKTSP